MQDIKTNHTSSQNLNPAEHEQLLAHSVNQADTLAQALAHADRGASGAPHAPSSQQAATSGWSPEQEQAAEVGREAAAPIVVATNEHALDAAQMAAVMTAQAGGTKPLQEAAAVAAAAAAAGNSGIAVNVTTPEAGLNSNASEQSVAAVADAVDASIEKLDLEEPQRSLLSLTWPIFIDISLHFATLIINTIMVGMVSVKAVAELTIGNQVFDLALIIFNFFKLGFVDTYTGTSIGYKSVFTHESDASSVTGSCIRTGREWFFRIADIDNLKSFFKISQIGVIT